MVGAVMHPYGFVLNHCKEEFRDVTPQGFQRDIDDLHAGRKPFDTLHPVMTRLADGSARHAAEVIARNLTRIFGALPELQSINRDTKLWRGRPA
jgi:hypothetical protein